MTLPDGYADVPPGKIAAVVTMLEMTAPRPARPAAEAMPRQASPPETAAEPPPGSPQVGWDFRRVPDPDLAWYRDLFRRVGEEWLWFSRLRLSDDALAAIVRDPRIEVYALSVDDRAEAMLELSFREPGECELSFLGLTRALIGRGAGRWLMNRAIDLAWAHPIRRFWVRTCTLDHPAALGFYMRSGFRPYRLQVEVADDPRLVGLVSRTAAPHVPLIADRDSPPITRT